MRKNTFPTWHTNDNSQLKMMCCDECEDCRTIRRRRAQIHGSVNYFPLVQDVNCVESSRCQLCWKWVFQLADRKTSTRKSFCHKLNSGLLIVNSHFLIFCLISSKNRNKLKKNKIIWKKKSWIYFCCVCTVIRSSSMLCKYE